MHKIFALFLAFLIISYNFAYAYAAGESGEDLNKIQTLSENVNIELPPAIEYNENLNIKLNFNSEEIKTDFLNISLYICSNILTNENAIINYIEKDSDCNIHISSSDIKNNKTFSAAGEKLPLYAYKDISGALAITLIIKNPTTNESYQIKTAILWQCNINLSLIAPVYAPAAEENVNLDEIYNSAYFSSEEFKTLISENGQIAQKINNYKKLKSENINISLAIDIKILNSINYFADNPDFASQLENINNLLSDFEIMALLDADINSLSLSGIENISYLTDLDTVFINWNDTISQNALNMISSSDKDFYIYNSLISNSSCKNSYCIIKNENISYNTSAASYGINSNITKYLNSGDFYKRYVAYAISSFYKTPSAIIENSSAISQIAGEINAIQSAQTNLENPSSPKTQTHDDEIQNTAEIIISQSTPCQYCSKLNQIWEEITLFSSLLENQNLIYKEASGVLYSYFKSDNYSKNSSYLNAIIDEYSALTDKIAFTSASDLTLLAPLGTITTDIANLSRWPIVFNLKLYSSKQIIKIEKNEAISLEAGSSAQIKTDISAVANGQTSLAISINSLSDIKIISQSRNLTINSEFESVFITILIAALFAIFIYGVITSLAKKRFPKKP